MNLLEGVVEELDVAALVKSDDGSFTLINQSCVWFKKLCHDLGCHWDEKQSVITESQLLETFLYLENFLIDANSLWEKASGERIHSSVWTEVDTSGREYQLNARATLIEGQAVLLIENQSPSFSKYHDVYQKARNIALVNEKLVSELNQRQRQLQSDIERHLMQDASIQQVADTIKGHTSAVMICQPDGEVEVINKALVDIYQLDSNIDLKRVSLLDQWLAEAEKAYPELKRAIESGSYWEGEFESHNAIGDKQWVRLSIGPVRQASGEVSHYVCVANDISEYRDRALLNERDAGFDVTTHLPNRRHFWRHITELSKTELAENYGIGLLYIDLDYFKRINDDLGHQAGDFLLSSVANRITRCVKYHDFVAHLGGDEFIVLVQFIEEEGQLDIVAERLLSSIHQPLFVNNQSVLMSASIGVSCCFEKNFDPKVLLKQADLAMYAAKELGKSQARFYEPSMEVSIPHKLQREREIHDAIERKEFVLFFQPQISIEGDGYLRVESLIRWQHPEHGLLPPADFITLAEDSGLIIPLGNWVLNESCRIGAQLQNSGKQVSIAANISAKQLRHPNFYNVLKDSLTATGMLPERLELEITESCFLEDMETVVDIIEKVRALGVAIALDDFGTGFSSLNYLRQLPVDYLKIDRSFIQELHLDHECKAITSSIISLAKELDISVIAEGVEKVEQLEFLKHRKVNYAQGFLFCHPLPISALSKIFDDIENLNKKYNSK